MKKQAATTLAKQDSKAIRKFILAQDWEGLDKKVIIKHVNLTEQRDMNVADWDALLKRQFPGKLGIETREKIKVALSQLRDNFQLEIAGKFYLSQSI